MKIRLCAIAKDESAYLAKWIHHHLYFGFSEILIYVNGSTDNSVSILEKISAGNPSINYKIADDMLAASLSENRNFQVDAYNDMYIKAKNDDIDYVMFLDIDEFWIPQNFQFKISDLVNQFKNSDFDAFSFSWMLDIPDHDRPPLVNPIYGSMKLLRNNHVKTLLKISERVERVSVHNHLIKNGKYLLDDGIAFEERDSVEQHRKSKVLEDYFLSNIDNIPLFFIYHAVYRSQAEYLVSLNRGRRHAADRSLFKTNRWGYVYDNSKPTINFSIKYECLITYYESFEKFIDMMDLYKEQQFAKLNFYSRYRDAVKIVKNNPLEVEKCAAIFRGLDIV